MLNQLQRGDEPALLPCRRSGFLRRPFVSLKGVGGRSSHLDVIKLVRAGA
jgi:hypothetical protein